MSANTEFGVKIIEPARRGLTERASKLIQLYQQSDDIRNVYDQERRRQAIRRAVRAMWKAILALDAAEGADDCL